MHLLIVDPNVAFGTLLREELVRLGHRVDVCSSGKNALSLAASDPPDLALLDMGIESPDALTLGRRLRALRHDVRLVLIPLIGESPVLTEGAPTIQGVLPKPFFLPELPERIAAAMDAPLDPANDRGTSAAAVPPVSSGGDRTNASALPDDDAGMLMEDAAPGDQDLDWLAALEPLASAGDDVRAGGDRGTAVRPTVEGALDEGPPDVTAVSEAMPTSSPDSSDPIDTPVAAGISLRAFRMNQGRIEALMAELAAEVGADSVILTCDSGLLTAVGGLQEEEIASISAAVLSSFRTSAEMARVLGREQLRFEQSIAGGSYLLYALGIEDAILAVTVGGDAPLGLLRHRARMTAERIAKLCG